MKDKIKDWWGDWGEFIMAVIVIIVVIMACITLSKWMNRGEAERCDDYMASLSLLGHQFTHRHDPCQILITHQEGDNLFYIWVDRDDFQFSIEEQAAGLK